MSPSPPPLSLRPTITPNLFDLFAAQQFDSQLPNAFAHILTQAFPQSAKYATEIANLMILATQGIWMGAERATIGETMWGIQRKVTNKKFTNWMQICAQMIPEYIAQRYQDYIDDLPPPAYGHPPHRNLLVTGPRLLQIWCLVRYLLNPNKYPFSPLAWILGITYKRPDPLANTDSHKRTIVDAIKHALPWAFFILQCMQWWSSSDRPSTAAAISDTVRTKIVRPPSFAKPLPNCTLIPGKCPICKESVSNPSTLPSGYIGCFSCMFDYVDSHKACPVTGISYDVDKLRRIYNEGIKLCTDTR